MIRVYMWDGRELYINPSNIVTMEMMKTDTQVSLITGKVLFLSVSSYDILSGQVSPSNKGPGKAGFDIL